MKILKQYGRRKKTDRRFFFKSNLIEGDVKSVVIPEKCNVIFYDAGNDPVEQFRSLQMSTSIVRMSSFLLWMMLISMGL